jgi:hypothetical protein
MIKYKDEGSESEFRLFLEKNINGKVIPFVKEGVNKIFDSTGALTNSLSTAFKKNDDKETK